MSGTLRHELAIYVLPESLRQIADEMEARMKEMTPGDDATAHFLYGDGFVVRFVVDVNLAQQKGLLK